MKNSALYVSYLLILLYFSDVSYTVSLSPTKENIKEEMPSTKVMVAGIEVTLPEDASALDKIDQTINDILSSSALSAVSL